MVFVALAVVFAALFVRLRFWQLDRLGQRRALNRQILQRVSRRPVAFDRLTDSANFVPVTVTGTPDYANELVYAGRSRNGSPGVYLLTPLRRPGDSPAVIVVRGWVYSPDAATVVLERWHEARTTFAGYAMTLPGRSAPAAKDRKIRVLTAPAIRSSLPYPV